MRQQRPKKRYIFSVGGIRPQPRRTLTVGKRRMPHKSDLKVWERGRLLKRRGQVPDRGTEMLSIQKRRAEWVTEKRAAGKKEDLFSDGGEGAKKD